jgi:hypothetical protein
MVSVGPPAGVARFDSVAAMVQAVGAFLNNRDVAALSGNPLLDLAMPAINRLPRWVGEWIYSIGGMTEAIGRAQLDSLDFDAIADWMAGLLPRRPYPAVFLGSSNGALIHVAAALGVPWLPQTFLCPVRDIGSDPDDAEAGFARGKVVTETILAARPDISVHHMLDPNQDRLMLKMMSYFRLKYRKLPAAYREFLMRCLPRGRYALCRRMHAGLARHTNERPVSFSIRWRRGTGCCRISTWRRAGAPISRPLRREPHGLASASARRRGA